MWVETNCTAELDQFSNRSLLFITINQRSTKGGRQADKILLEIHQTSLTMHVHMELGMTHHR